MKAEDDGAPADRLQPVLDKEVRKRLGHGLELFFAQRLSYGISDMKTLEREIQQLARHARIDRDLTSWGYRPRRTPEALTFLAPRALLSGLDLERAQLGPRRRRRPA